MKYRGVILTKCIIVEEDAKAFHQSMYGAIESLEAAAQMYGWGASVVPESTDEQVVFPVPPDTYS